MEPEAPDVRPGSSAVRGIDLAVFAFVIAACAPALLFRYLPLTDLPQHLAVASVLGKHDGGPSQFTEYFLPDYGKTLYLAPYLATVALGKVLPLRLAMHVTTFVAMATYPVGLLLLLHRLGRPKVLALLGVPLVYNRALFWGFVNFQASMGLAVLGMSLVPRAASRGRTLGLAAIGLALVFTHTHGLVLLIAFGLCFAAFERTLVAVRSLVPLAPGLLGCVAWLFVADAAPGYGTSVWPLFSERLNDLPASVFGSYADGSESLLLMAFVAIAWWLARSRMSLNALRSATTSSVEKALAVLVVLNVILYFVLPEHTMTAKYVHFRHAVMAALLLPPLCAIEHGPTALKRAVVVAMGLGAAVHVYGNWAAFDVEARSFDRILAALPRAPRLLSLVFDRNGNIFRTSPYLHFAGYAQAEVGGDLSTSFAMFWNVPVRRVAPAPALPLDFEWHPERYDDEPSGRYYTHAIVRLPGKRLPRSAAFPFELVLESGAWQLYRRAAEEGRP